MESRKDQLQKQIFEAVKANDNDLYYLLKSQWAHRFGVESLEELKDLDLTILNQKTTFEDNQENDQSQDYSFEAEQETSLKNDAKEEKEIINDAQNEVKSIEVENKESFETKSYEIVDKENGITKETNMVIEYKSHPKVDALIPIPPKPKYSYLKKWLIGS